MGSEVEHRGIGVKLCETRDLQHWMKEPNVNGIAKDEATGWFYPIWVWIEGSRPEVDHRGRKLTDAGSPRFFDPDGLEIVAPRSYSFNSDRAQKPPPGLRDG